MTVIDDPPVVSGAWREGDPVGHRQFADLGDLRLERGGALPAVLTVLAALTWHLGEGTLTRMALDRALALEPGYRLALLLERMVDLAIRPGQVLSSTG